jgi:hypothetical protein
MINPLMTAYFICQGENADTQNVNHKGALFLLYK